MSPRPSRTVTGVFTRATCTLTLAWVSLGGNWTSTPGLGGMGPEGACARAGAPATARRSVRVNDAPAIRIIRLTWSHRISLARIPMQLLKVLNAHYYAVRDSTKG